MSVKEIGKFVTEQEIETLKGLMLDMMYPDPPDDGDRIRYQIQTIAKIVGEEEAYEKWIEEVA